MKQGIADDNGRSWWPHGLGTGLVMAIVTATVVGGAAEAGGIKNAERLTLAELDSLRSQVDACWKPPRAEGPLVRVHIHFAEDGTLARPPEVLNRRETEDFAAFAAAAVKAVEECQAYELPPAKYVSWREIIMNFDPKAFANGESAPAGDAGAAGSDGDAPPGPGRGEYLGS